MGFEALSCAIARVIINYHAHQTQKAPINTNSDDTLEHILNCSIDEINQTLEAKIADATTKNNTRLTLLQYMHFGISLSERARVTENPDEIETIKPQLIQFIQNIQLLLTTTNFSSPTLSIPTDEKQSLSIYRLNYPTAQEAYKLTQELLSTMGLSPESTEASIQKNINDRFLLKKNPILSQENTALEAVITLLNQEVSALKEEIDLLATLESTHQRLQVFKPTYKIHEAHEAHEAHDWEFIPDALLENNRLIAQNQAFTKHHEEMQQYHTILKLHQKNIVVEAAIKASNETITHLQTKFKQPQFAPTHDAENKNDGTEDSESMPSTPQSLQSENERLTAEHQRLDACHKKALEKIKGLTDDELARQSLINTDINTNFTRRGSSNLSYRTHKTQKSPHIPFDSKVITQQPMGTDTENRAVYPCPPSLTMPGSLFLMSIFAPSLKLSNRASDSTSSESASNLVKHEKFN
jgi:hypothetical protein